MQQKLIPLLEKALNGYLALDPEAFKKLARLSGKVMTLEITDWHTTVYLLPNTTGIVLKSSACMRKKPIDTIHAEIKGTSLNLLRMGLTKPKDQNATAKSLTIKGDIHLAHQITQILQQLEINLEEPLPRITGDVIAHQIGVLARRFQLWKAKTKHQISQNITEYLQEESRQLPTREEIEYFFSDIAQLKNDIARFESTLKNAHENHTKNE